MITCDKNLEFFSKSYFSKEEKKIQQIITSYKHTPNFIKICSGQCQTEFFLSDLIWNVISGLVKIEKPEVGYGKPKTSVSKSAQMIFFKLNR